MSKSYSFRLYPDEFWNQRKRSRSKGRVEVYVPEKEIKHDKALIIFPGGGYGTLSFHEGLGIANYFASRGFLSFVVYYRVFPEKFPAAIEDGYRAIRLIKKELRVNFPRIAKVVAIGFSAGGHLVSLLGGTTDFSRDPIQDEHAVISVSLDGMMLIYPLLSFIEKTHMISVKNFVDPDNLKIREELSIETNIGIHNPPAFLVHSYDDNVVPIDAALRYAEEARQMRIPVEAHFYETGGHGFGIDMEPGSPKIRQWPLLAEAWLLNI